MHYCISDLNGNLKDMQKLLTAFNFDYNSDNLYILGNAIGCVDTSMDTLIFILKAAEKYEHVHVLLGAQELDLLNGITVHRGRGCFDYRICLETPSFAEWVNERNGGKVFRQYLALPEQAQNFIYAGLKQMKHYVSNLKIGKHIFYLANSIPEYDSFYTNYFFATKQCKQWDKSEAFVRYSVNLTIDPIADAIANGLDIKAKSILVCGNIPASELPMTPDLLSLVAINCDGGSRKYINKDAQMRFEPHYVKNIININGNVLADNGGLVCICLNNMHWRFIAHRDLAVLKPKKPKKNKSNLARKASLYQKELTLKTQTKEKLAKEKEEEQRKRDAKWQEDYALACKDPQMLSQMRKVQFQAICNALEGKFTNTETLKPIKEQVLLNSCNIQSLSQKSIYTGEGIIKKSNIAKAWRVDKAAPLCFIPIDSNTPVLSSVALKHVWNNSNERILLLGEGNKVTTIADFLSLCEEYNKYKIVLTANNTYYAITQVTKTSGIFGLGNSIRIAECAKKICMGYKVSTSIL